jgi:TrmH family RNA methyltransferase
VPTLVPSTAVPLQPVGPSHEAARLYSRTRRNLLPRGDRLVAVGGRWQHELLARAGVRPTVTLCCETRPLAPADAAYEISARTLARLHPGATEPAWLSVVRLPRWHPADALRPDAQLLLVADGIEYAGNLGTLVRTADAAGAGGVLITNAAARLTHPKVFEASRGTVLTTPVLEYDDVAGARRDLTAAGFTPYVADPAAAVDYRDVAYEHRKVAVVVGSEGDGVAAAWRTTDLTRVSIPMRGSADSLNVATSASVLLFDAAARLGPR